MNQSSIAVAALLCSIGHLLFHDHKFLVAAIAFEVVGIVTRLLDA